MSLPRAWLLAALLAPLGAFALEAPAGDIYAQPPSTILGCECDGACDTSILFKCDTAPICTVKSKNCTRGTADWSFGHGYYDYCVYGPYRTYEQLPAKRKQAIVLDRLNAGGSSKFPSAAALVTGIFGESVMVSFDASADVFPDKRTKYIHSVGVAGGIRFDSTGSHQYSGLFQGAEYGVIRFSSAKEPSCAGGSAPGMAVKFFRDGRPSANFVAMYSLDGQPPTDKDFFAHEWSNHINMTDDWGLQFLAKKFWQASYCPLQVGLSDLASDATGEVGMFPYKLNFHALVSSDCPCGDYAQCLANLEENLTPGTKLFEVRAVAAPGAAAELIGHLTVTSKLTRSKFGDEELFFRHQRMEDDFGIKPEWLAAIDRKTECGMNCASTEAPTIEVGCSSPFDTTSGMLQTDVVTV